MSEYLNAAGVASRGVVPESAPGSPISASNPLPTASIAGLGSLASLPAASTNGTPLGTLPAGAIGARLYLGASDSVTFTIATSQPVSAPANSFTVSGSSNPCWDENLAGGAMIYVTAKSGSPQFRWY